VGNRDCYGSPLQTALFKGFLSTAYNPVPYSHAGKNNSMIPGSTALPCNIYNHVQDCIHMCNTSEMYRMYLWGYIDISVGHHRVLLSGCAPCENHTGGLILLQPKKMGGLGKSGVVLRAAKLGRICTLALECHHSMCIWVCAGPCCGRVWVLSPQNVHTHANALVFFKQQRATASQWWRQGVKLA